MGFKKETIRMGSVMPLTELALACRSWARWGWKQTYPDRSANPVYVLFLLYTRACVVRAPCVCVCMHACMYSYQCVRHIACVRACMWHEDAMRAPLGYLVFLVFDGRAAPVRSNRFCNAN
jgi:hypothetical protein